MCKLVQEELHISALSSLSEVEYISFFYNQKVSELWDMTNNEKIVGLSISDFLKLHSLKGIEKAANLISFYIYDRVEPKMEIESLKPVVNTE